MTTEIGEYIVGAYLRIVEKCNIIDYNARPPEEGVKGMAELDVVGLRFADNKAYLCEVVTHIKGINYGGYGETIKRIKAKYGRQKAYKKKYLRGFKPCYMLWSPVVPKGVRDQLDKIKNFEVVVNEKYAKCIDKLEQRAKETSKDIGNPFFRTLQILHASEKFNENKKSVKNKR